MRVPSIAVTRAAKGVPHVGRNPEDFVQNEVARGRREEAVGRDAVLFAALERRRDDCPEVVRERADPREEKVRVVEDLVGEIVFRGKPERRRLDAHVHVLRDENGHVLGEVRRKAAYDGENAVVPLVGRQFRRKGRSNRTRFKVELSLRLDVPEGREVEPFRKGPSGVGLEKRVERAREASAVAGDFGRPDLVVVELLERRHREEHVVLGKAEEAARIVQKHVRVEHEELLAVFSHDGASAAVARGLFGRLSLGRRGEENVRGGQLARTRGFGGGRRHVDAFGGHRRHGLFVGGRRGFDGSLFGRALGRPFLFGRRLRGGLFLLGNGGGSGLLRLLFALGGFLRYRVLRLGFGGGGLLDGGRHGRFNGLRGTGVARADALAQFFERFASGLVLAGGRLRARRRKFRAELARCGR